MRDLWCFHAFYWLLKSKGIVIECVLIETRRLNVFSLKELLIGQTVMEELAVKLLVVVEVRDTPLHLELQLVCKE